jgi:hypothetical protein
MPSPLRQVYLDVKGKQSIEQLGLAIKMMFTEPAARNLRFCNYKSVKSMRGSTILS